jgi:Mn2+/Fe2+ NRAMP family transporter
MSRMVILLQIVLLVFISIRVHGLSLMSCLTLLSGKHLSEHCRTEYPRYVNFVLWILAEVSIVASDIPEGTLIICVQVSLGRFSEALVN